MTNEELAEIEARAMAASPGPWMYDTTFSGEYYVGGAGDDGVPLAYMRQSREEQHRNAAFIAPGRLDVPALIAEVRRLQDALNEMMEFNPLRNDRDAYLLALTEWGLKGKWGVNEEFTERPKRATFGLE